MLLGLHTYSFSMDMGGMGIIIQHDLDEAITNLAPRAFTNHFRDDHLEFQR
jgi:hypothetical protein